MRKVSRRWAISRGCLVGCGLLLLLVVVIGVWLARLTAPRTGEVVISDHHPFRSPAAKERYLARYDARAEAWPVPSQTAMVETSWGRTFVRASGPVEGPPLVLLPGASATSLQWLPNVAALSRTHRVYAVDNIYDFGRSVYTRRFESPADFVAWLDELFDALGLGDDLALVGLSYGGWLTAEYALGHPDRLVSAVLLAPAGTVQPLSGGFIRRAILAALPHRYFVRDLIHWFAEDSLRGGEEMSRQIDEFVEDGYLGLRSFAFKPMVPPRVISDEELSSIGVPTLFLVGENEKLYSPTLAVERLGRVAPHVAVEIVSGAGHDLTLAQSERVNARILEFLAEEAGQGTSERAGAQGTDIRETDAGESAPKEKVE